MIGDWSRLLQVELCNQYNLPGPESQFWPRELGQSPVNSFPELILASRSPRRKELLRQAGYAFSVVPPSEAAECGVHDDETPAQLVARLACQKAADVARRIHEGLVLGCDTVVECRGRILGKPAGREDARAMLEALAGQEHRVLSGLCLLQAPDGPPTVRVAVTSLRMDQLTPQQLDEYLAAGQWQGKAGAFGYQDGLDWVHVLEGSESNVVGLPLELLAEMVRPNKTGTGTSP
jgi:septum formation protein